MPNTEPTMRRTRHFITAVAAGALILGGCSGESTVETISAGAEFDTNVVDVDRDFATDLAERGRGFQMVDAPAVGVITRDEAVKIAIDFDPRGTADNVTVRYGQYSRAEMARDLPSEFADSNAELLETIDVYIVTLHDVEIPIFGPPGIEDPDSAATEKNVIINARIGAVVEAISYK